MTYTTVKQLACPPPEAFDEPLAGVCDEPLADWIRPRVLELTYTSHRMAPYARDILGLADHALMPPPYRWDPDRRAHLMAELDAAMFVLYGLTRDEVDHVLDSFAVIRKYEERDHGDFVTKRRILTLFEQFSEVNWWRLESNSRGTENA